jgi:NADP-dependent 3-hydroxy acid dehydrogenase YdfG
MSKTVLISGGTKGIGKAAVLALLEEGFNVATFSRDKNTCNEFEKELSNNWDPERFLITNANVSSEEEMQKFVASTIQKFNSIDILINNAGFGYFEDSDKVDSERFQEMVQTNLLGLALLTKHVIPIMKEKKSGLIINIASMSGKRSYPRGEFYSATKFGVMGYSDGLRRELQEHGIKVSTICPGVVDTDFFSEQWKKKREEKGEPMMSCEDISRVISLICTQSENSNIQHIEVLPFPGS